MTDAEILTITLHVPHAASAAFQQHPPALVRWLTALGLWPAQAQTVRWRIDPVSQAMVATCEVPVAVGTAQEGPS